MYFTAEIKSVNTFGEAFFQVRKKWKLPIFSTEDASDHYSHQQRIQMQLMPTYHVKKIPDGNRKVAIRMISTVGKAVI